MTVIFKTLDIEVVEKRENGGRIVITTPAFDRVNDRIMPRGGRMDNYLANPVVQWGHNYYDPWATVGKTVLLNVTDEGIEVDFELRPAANDADPQNIVKLLWDGGWVRTASVGIDPVKVTPNEKRGRDFIEWDLLEWSLVPIPMNQEALRIASKAFDAQEAKVEAEAETKSEEGEEAEVGITAKAGRVLSATNEGKIRGARDLLDEVLDQLEQSPVEEPMNDPMMDETTMAAWVRRLVVNNDYGEQHVLACFYKYEINIAPDATKLTINEYGDLVEVPHPDAGKSVTRKEVNFVPPINIWDDSWGDDAVYSISTHERPDTELVEGKEWEVVSMSAVLAGIPNGAGATTKSLRQRTVAGTDLCRVTRSRIGLVKRSVAASKRVALAAAAGWLEAVKEQVAGSK